MNELEIYEEEVCGRCRGPMTNDRYSLRVDSDPPLETPVELWICERCMESMTRWIGRRQGPGPGPSPSRGASSGAEGSSRRSSSGRRRRSRKSHYTSVLDKNDAWIHRKSWLLVWLTVAGVAALLGMILLVVMTDLTASLRLR